VWPLIILGSCCAAPAPYAAVQSVVSAATMPLWPCSKMTDHLPEARFAAQPSRQPLIPFSTGRFASQAPQRPASPPNFPERHDLLVLPFARR
jgi:hypothetical protein